MTEKIPGRKILDMNGFRFFKSKSNPKILLIVFC